MNNRAADAPLVTFSCTVYRLLLTAYPARFRRAYGADMLQVFRDSSRRTMRERGTNGMTRFWALTLFDLVRSVPEQHLQKEAYMSKSQFIRVSGLALILSSLPYAMPNVSLAAWLIGSILLGIGILGLRARYAASVGPFGSRILLGGVIGMLAIYVILVVMYLGLTRGGTLGLEGTNAFNPDNLWMLVYSGPLLPLIALALFGVSELRHKPISHLNWLPLATGVWFPVLWGFLIVYQFAHHGTFPNQYWNSIVMPLLLFQFFMLCLLGSVLIFDKGQEMATA